ncbi:hypothetical protein DICVIV_03948 [Dictyocaulus viviparus]|uniref:P-type ATPase A domain-containing protein n=1 Tax=Dictyocaulus viviparus TaxID=29172 RepID=A0A0D8XZ43_DICVI|nr:hypothetical protein DICVIV_03948 [Dictyocaulus viviparus]
MLLYIKMLPGLSPFGKQATILPLMFIIGCSAIRETYEDLRRRVRDRRMNYQKCYAHTDNGWKTVPWCELHVGQMVRVVNGEQLAADILLLATSEAGSVAYVETANLDGESNLKEFWNSGIVIHYDAPNRNIYEFQGYMEGHSPILQNVSGSNSNQTDTTTNAHVILRGARLKNTDNIYGIVLYTGHDTKLYKNSIKSVTKSSLLARLTNSIMLTQFGIIMLLCLMHAVMIRLAQPLPFLVTQFSNHYDVHYEDFHITPITCTHSSGNISARDLTCA